MKYTPILICWVIVLGNTLTAVPMDALYARLSYKRSTEELVLQKTIVRAMPLMSQSGSEWPMFIGRTIDEEGRVVAEASIRSPMFLSVPPDESGNPPPESIIEQDEGRFAFTFPYVGIEVAIQVYEVEEETAEPVLIGEVELP